MPAEASKPDIRELVGKLTVALIVLLTLLAIAGAWSVTAAVGLALLAGAGFVLARMERRRAVDVPIPRAPLRRWSKGLFRTTASDQPFNTRLGWTSGNEPGGTLPDPRRVVPQGSYGVGLMTDTAAGLLVIAAIIFSAFRYGSPLGAVVAFSLLGLTGFALIRFTRWLRGR